MLFQAKECRCFNIGTIVARPQSVSAVLSVSMWNVFSPNLARRWKVDGGGEWRTAVCRRGNNRYLEKLSKTCVVTVVRGGRGYLADIYVIVMAPRIIGFISLQPTVSPHTHRHPRFYTSYIFKSGQLQSINKLTNTEWPTWMTLGPSLNTVHNFTHHLECCQFLQILGFFRI